MLRIWGRRSAFNVQKVMWLIGELKLDHVHVEAGGSFGGLDTPEFLRMNPHGRIPVLDDGGTVCRSMSGGRISPMSKAGMVASRSAPPIASMS
ncbi:MAG: glutathione S-transferase N-terminal domain-containing protein [Hyphomicrobiales bacterium]